MVGSSTYHRCSLVRPTAALLLAGDAILGPRDGLQPLRRNRFFTFSADTVGAVFDAAERLVDLLKLFIGGAIAVQEEPFLMALLGHVAVVVGLGTPSYHGGGGGTAAFGEQASALLEELLRLAILFAAC